MDVILKVLEGAKQGTKIAVKKDEFLVGRSPKCHLCAGSSSVSRRHCMFTRKEASITVQDLGSRNGTLVNGQKITAETELASGDEIGVGSLKFLITITHGINNTKRPKVKTVADAIDRTAASADASIADDDISRWLLEVPDAPSSHVASETQTIRMDDTNAVHLRSEVEKSPEMKATVEESDQDSSATSDAEEEAAEEDTDKKSKKPKPGKLPPIPTEPSSKDSREAAMQALRNWNRRR